MDKNCGECKHFDTKGSMCLLIDCNHEFAPDKKSCLDFEPLHPSNGDVIRQGGNRALADFQQLNTCDNCIYNNDSRLHNYCDKPIDKTCTDGVEAWLNAPAESEGDK